MERKMERDQPWNFITGEVFKNQRTEDEMMIYVKIYPYKVKDQSYTTQVTMIYLEIEVLIIGFKNIF